MIIRILIATVAAFGLLGTISISHADHIQWADTAGGTVPGTSITYTLTHDGNVNWPINASQTRDGDHTWSSGGTHMGKTGYNFSALLSFDAPLPADRLTLVIFGGNTQAGFITVEVSGTADTQDFELDPGFALGVRTDFDYNPVTGNFTSPAGTNSNNSQIFGTTSDTVTSLGFQTYDFLGGDLNMAMIGFVVPQPTYSIGKAVLDDTGTAITTAEVGDIITYRLSFTNTGASDLTGAVVTDTLPANLGFIDATATPAAAVTYDFGPPATVTWPVGAVAAGGSANLDIDMEILAGAAQQTLTNQAEVTAIDAPAVAGQSASVDLQVVAAPVAEYAIGKIVLDNAGAAITTAEVGDDITYRITVTNSGGVDLTGIEVTDTLPDSLQYIGASGPGSGSVTYDPGPPATVTWPLGAVSSGGLSSLDIDMTILAGADQQTITNQAEVTAIDAPAVAGQTAAVDLQVGGPPLAAYAIGKFVMDDTGTAITSAEVGDDITYRISVANTGAVDLSGIAVMDTLPDNLQYIGATATPINGSVAYDPGPPATVTWPVGALATGGSASLDIDMTLLAGADQQTITNQAEVTAIDAPAVAGQSASADLGVGALPQADIEVVEATYEAELPPCTPTPPFISCVKTWTYRVWARNNGADTAEGVEILWDYPMEIYSIANVRIITGTGNPIGDLFVCEDRRSQHQIHCVLPAPNVIDPGESAVLFFEVISLYMPHVFDPPYDPYAAYSDNVSVTATASTFDPDSTNNSGNCAEVTPGGGGGGGGCFISGALRSIIE